MKIKTCNTFRVTRDADIEIAEDEAEDEADEEGDDEDEADEDEAAEGLGDLF